MNLESVRDYIKNEISGDKSKICELAKQAQNKGLRICPRNIYCDKIAEKICVSSPCRKNFATCFKKYFKEKEMED